MSSKIIASIILIVMAITVDICLKHTAEKCIRKQANFRLEQMAHCLDKALPLINKEEALQTCVAKSRTTHTGDAYVLDAYTLEFLYDASNDTTKQEKLYFTKESVGEYFQDWESAERFITQVTMGKNSDNSAGGYYRFDDADEWLEWRYYPSELSINYKERKLILIQGSQSDEVMKSFDLVRWIIKISVLLIIIILITIHKNQNQSLRHKDAIK